MKAAFEAVVSFKVPEEVNEILYCAKSAPSWRETKKGGRISAQHPVLTALRATNAFVASKDTKFANNDALIDLEDAVKLLTVN